MVPPGAGPVRCWGRCGAQAGGGPACSLLSPPATTPHVCLSILQLLCHHLVLSSVSFTGLRVPGSSGPLRVPPCLSVSLSGSLFSFTAAAEGLPHLTARFQPSGSANRISRGTVRSCSSTRGVEGHPHGAQSSRGQARFLPLPVPKTCSRPGRLASPVLRKPRGPTR